MRDASLICQISDNSCLNREINHYIVRILFVHLISVISDRYDLRPVHNRDHVVFAEETVLPQAVDLYHAGAQIHTECIFS